MSYFSNNLSHSTGIFSHYRPPAVHLQHFVDALAVTDMEVSNFILSVYRHHQQQRMFGFLVFGFIDCPLLMFFTLFTYLLKLFESVFNFLNCLALVGSEVIKESIAVIINLHA